MVLPSGLKATLRNVALLHGEWLVDQAFACGHVPQHHAADAADPLLQPYPAAMVLPSGLKATLRTLPSFTASGSSTRRLRAATSHSTTPPLAAAVNPAAMVLPSG